MIDEEEDWFYSDIEVGLKVAKSFKCGGSGGLGYW